MQQIRVYAIAGIVLFGLASIALAITGFVVALLESGMGCPGCSTSTDSSSHSTYYFVGAGLCVVASVVCAVAMRRKSAPPAEPPEARPKSNKLGLR